MRREDSEWFRQGFTKDWWKSLPLDQRDVFLEAMDDRTAEEYFRDWRVWARDKQLPPTGNDPGADWNEWLIVAGRGFGKTLAAVEFFEEKINTTPFPLRIAIVGQGKDDIRTVMVEGQSGFLNRSPSWNKPLWSPAAGGGILTWPRDGTQAFVYSAEDTEALRGPEFHYAWFDEPMAVPPDKRERAADNLDFCLRLGDNPQLVITTTPKNHRWMKAKLDAALDPKNKILLTRGTTDENDALPDKFKQKVYGKYGGTRLGRQELLGELLGDEEGALWTSEQLDECRLKNDDAVEMAARCDKVVVGVDPNKQDTAAASKTKNAEVRKRATATAHAAGIIVVGSRGRERLVLADRSISGGPSKWGAAVVKAAIEFGANEVIVEANQGGDMAKIVIQQAADTLEVPVKVILGHASKGKIRRAEPISGLYDQNRVKHVGTAEELKILEDQMCAIHDGHDPTGEDFDRLDALVWGLTRLGVKKSGRSSATSSGGFVPLDQFSGASSSGSHPQIGYSPIGADD